jgi:hypothetical protein
LAKTNSYELVIDNKKDVEGLPEGLIEASAAEAKAKGNEGKCFFYFLILALSRFCNTIRTGLCAKKYKMLTKLKVLFLSMINPGTNNFIFFDV